MELQKVNRNLPDTIEDLSKFVLVNEEKVQALRAQIRAIKKVSLAREVYEQKLAEAQEVGQITVEAAQKMGELLLQIQKSSGARTDLKTSSNNHEEVKTKTEITSEMGMSKDQVSQYQQMALNPEAVQTAIQKAIERGDVVSRSQVMKEIRAIKEQLAEKDKKIAELEQMEPEVITKEVTPDDYRDAKRKAKAFDAETARLQRKLDDAYRKQNELEDRIRDMEHATKEGLEKSNLSENVFYFCAMCNNFIGNVGGLVWLTEHINDMPKREREMFLKAANSFKDWSLAFTANLERSMNEQPVAGTDPSVSLLSDYRERGEN